MDPPDQTLPEMECTCTRKGPTTTAIQTELNEYLREFEFLYIGGGYTATVAVMRQLVCIDTATRSADFWWLYRDSGCNETVAVTGQWL